MEVTYQFHFLYVTDSELISETISEKKRVIPSLKD